MFLLYQLEFNKEGKRIDTLHARLGANATRSCSTFRKMDINCSCRKKDESAPCWRMSHHAEPFILCTNVQLLSDNINSETSRSCIIEIMRDGLIHYQRDYPRVLTIKYICMLLDSAIP